MSDEHPFKLIPEEDCVRKLPFYFGGGIEVVELNLSDSTTGRRIRLPGRGSRCDHIDLVDVRNSTRASEAGEIEYMCPVCGLEYMSTEDIDVDELVIGILAELDAEDPEGVIRSINLNIDGSWTHVSDDPEQRVPMVRKKRPRLTLAQATAVAGLGSGAVDLDSSSESDRAPPQRRMPASGPAEVVDLVDSDED